MNNFGKALKESRRQRGLTLRSLGEKIGKPISYISDIEQGRKQPPSETVVALFESALGIEVGTLVRLAKEVKAFPKKVVEQARVRPRLSEVLLRADQDLSDEGWEEAMEFIKQIQKKERKLGNQNDNG